ncbi:MAG: nitrogenase component 1 [Firmicutes bacterium]|nr:nitrogenase component 1 [Bacillota bacterium]
MLTKLNPRSANTKICDAEFPIPFKSGLEYSAPARGTWNIVHTGMLIPEVHEVFVCAASCLRGVVLTAAEMKAQKRFSTIEIRENNLLNGDMEQLITDGVSDIIAHLAKRPPAILLYTSCIHHFVGCDMHIVFDRLAEMFPDIAFTDCYMNPIMRKSGLDPDRLMRRQLYSLLKPRQKIEKSVNIIGNDLPTDESSELTTLLKSGGFSVKDITSCKSYTEYLEMAESTVNIVYYPAAKPAGEYLECKLGQKLLYLPASFNYCEIRRCITALVHEFKLPPFDFNSAEERCENALKRLSGIIGNTPVAIDYTAVYRPFELAKLLSEHGINVTHIYADSISNDDKDAFLYLQKNVPNIILMPTVNVLMRVLPHTSSETVLAIGQKAAYFTGTNNFVNIIEGGGHWGYDGILRLCAEAEDAFLHKKDAKNIIQVKGWGCSCC